ncbi:NADPH-dependent FMN reductase [Phaeobacter piscinae]|uniref:NADPH-dependent FMN reductase n=1 Tax=Phaeobacter piscinae TaxID=1580596 RepID=UPI000C9BD8BD|nr:NADPH-dependent FMN reductase [Phaeobacter piscinae]
MRILAISGSTRAASTNTAMLNAVAEIAAANHEIAVFSGLADLPVFSPDAEQGTTPPAVQRFADLVRQSDALIISSPEYAHAIPGGLKNAIDWMVSRDEIIGKPIALMHASRRGDDMLAQLRLVLSTVSDQFRPDLFLRFNFLKLSPEEIAKDLCGQPKRSQVEDFLRAVASSCA